MKMMNNLPDEILLRVFKYLPPKERRERAQLVCRRWKQIASDYTFTNDEVVVVDRYSEQATIFQHLRRNDFHRKYNLKFVRQSIRLNKEFQSFLSSNGHKIVSLSFHDGSLDGDVLRTIFLSCPNLITFSAACSTAAFFNDLHRSLNSVADSNITVTSVSSFSLEMNINRTRCDFPVPNFFRKFSIFPNVICLRICVVSQCVCDTMIHAKREEHVCTASKYSGIYEYVESVVGKLKRLTLHMPETSKKIDISPLLPHLKRMEKLSLSGVKFWDHNQPKPYAPLMELRTIESLDIVLSPYVGRIPAVIRRVVNNFTNLQILKLHCVPDLSFRVDIARTILGLRLKVLHVTFSQTIQSNFENVSETFPFNHTLEEISFDGSVNAARLCQIFVEHVQNLRYLYVAYPTNVLLQKIFKHQPSLKSLTLIYCDLCLDYGFTGVKIINHFEGDAPTYSIQRLKELEYLKITEYEYCHISMRTFSHLKLPKLKCLIFATNNEILARQVSYEVLLQHTEVLLEAVENSPLLEVLHIEFPLRDWFKKFLALQSKPKHLRYLYVTDWPKAQYYPIERLLSEKFFRKYPSLRVFVYNCARYDYDKHTKTIHFDQHSRFLCNRPNVIERKHLFWPDPILSLNPVHLS